SNQRRRVTHPRLFDVLTDPADPVDEPLEGAKDRMKKCPLAFKNAIHENAQRFRNDEHNREEHHYLCNTKCSHLTPLLIAAPYRACIRSRSSETFRSKQRIH